MLRDASSRGVRVIGYVSAAFGYTDPENGALYKPDIDEINAYIDLLIDHGVDAVTLSDLQGIANKKETRQLLETILDKRKGKNIDMLGYHPHNVAGEQAIANSKVVYDLGIRRFDSSLGRIKKKELNLFPFAISSPSYPRISVYRRYSWIIW
jgi:isopropylmalate/homocitrate/citramalate synthase